MYWGTGWLSRLDGHFVEESSNVLGNWVAQSVSWTFCGGVERLIRKLDSTVSLVIRIGAGRPKNRGSIPHYTVHTECWAHPAAGTMSTGG